MRVFIPEKCLQETSRRMMTSSEHLGHQPHFNRIIFHTFISLLSVILMLHFQRH